MGDRPRSLDAAVVRRVGLVCLGGCIDSDIVLDIRGEIEAERDR